MGCYGEIIYLHGLTQKNIDKYIGKYIHFGGRKKIISANS